MRTEAEEQEAVMRWAEMSLGVHPELALLFHIPNGGSRNKVEAAHLKRLGVKKGVPDLFLPVARKGYHGLFIEMKRERGSYASEEQMIWLTNLRLEGYMAMVCRGYEHARNVIEEYLK